MLPTTDTTETYFPVPFYEYSQEEFVEMEDTSTTCQYESIRDIFEPFADKKNDTIITRESLFVNHKLQKTSNNEIKHEPQTPSDFVFFSLLSIPLIISLILKINTNKITSIFKSLFLLTELKTLFYGGFGKIGMRTLIFFLYSLSSGLFIYWSVSFFDITFPFIEIKNSFLLFGVIFLAFNIILLLKYLTVKVFGNIFQSKGITKIYLFNITIYNFIISIVFGLFLFLLYFKSLDDQYYIFQILIGILVVLYFLRLFMCIKILLLEANFSKPYLFYYLCIIEVMPIFVLVKYLT